MFEINFQFASHLLFTLSHGHFKAFWAWNQLTFYLYPLGWSAKGSVNISLLNRIGENCTAMTTNIRLIKHSQTQNQDVIWRAIGNKKVQFQTMFRISKDITESEQNDLQDILSSTPYLHCHSKSVTTENAFFFTLLVKTWAEMISIGIAFLSWSQCIIELDFYLFK